ncbi:putative membrane protein YkgB [Silvibacterium bohemicum]|uniref:Putative membrane protein YkgB n=1 Tax=Silvibacterium bohemicum TaxID=1577686 RepID=A0A841JTC7_9BACT|nr:DUF417 family protein [Silvibacterium bohemicum]MBB6144410.1 putative membrane protein YkgB [Silvibacterium bohemicum]
MERFFQFAAGLDIWGVRLLRIALFIVLVWIGGLKVTDYEADGIVPLIANSPFMSFLYTHPAPEYRTHTSPEGKVSDANHQWEESNRTYPVSYALGVAIITIAILIVLAPVAPRISAIGSLLLVCMSFTTLSFLVTTPEAWVQPLGAATHGFPYLSIAGRLIVKDCIMMAAAVVTLADSAKRVLARRSANA